MFCNQCEQTRRKDGVVGCMTNVGVCGKTAESASIQDLILAKLQILSYFAKLLRDKKFDLSEVNKLTLKATFSTLTNVNFDDDSLFQYIQDIDTQIARAINFCNENSISFVEYKYSDITESQLQAIQDGNEISSKRQIGYGNEDVDSLRALILFGIKGVAAYTYHAMMLGQEVSGLVEQLQDTYIVLLEQEDDLDTLLAVSLKLGEINLATMSKLEAGHIANFGTPEPTQVRVTPVKGKAILVSGHDLVDLKKILEQTEDKGINVYTHGEVLPGNAYPELKKFDHLVGNYGGAWQKQQIEFSKFPGAILMTSNCIKKPLPSYENRIFTTGPVAWPNVPHISGGDFSQVIDAALNAEGFEEDAEEQFITTGFAKDTVLSVADTVVNAVKSGAIEHFYLIGGCDGSEKERSYFTDVANLTTDKDIILTLGCGKYRFNKLNFGDIGGIPRVLDIGQCNDSYGAIQIAIALAGAFECDVNELPLSFYVSWLEQKAVAVLLTLLHLGIKGIHLGPQLPAFITPNILNILVRNYEIKPITTAAADMGIAQ